ncbi:MAG: oligoendopeptidase F [Candidatus Nanohaloarchaea archaeon]|jgi:oligoendopeptidase F
MVKEREEIEQQYKWDLTEIFESEEEWREKRSQVEEELDEIEEYKGQLTNSAQTLLNGLKAKDNLMRDISNLAAYARMKTHEDMSDQKAQELKSKADSLQSQAASKVGFYQPEIKKLSREQFESYIEEEEELEEYRHYIRNILRLHNHILDTETESMLNDLGEILSTPQETYSMLTNADLTFPTVEREGEEVQITNANFTKLLKDEDRDFRKEVYNGFYERIGQFRNSITTMLDKEIRKNVKMSRIRNYDTARKASLKQDNIPISVYDNLVDTVEDNLDVLHRHLELKKQVQDLDELEMHDIYMPITEKEQPEIEYEEAKQHVLEALQPLGEEYVDKAEEFLENRWIDVYENKGKRSGAYSGGTYDTPSYILLNYQEDVNSMYTLAHELGHSLHSELANQEQGYLDSQYKIFVAEIASTLNEILLTRHLLEKGKYKEHALDYVLEGFRNTLFRQTLFADFERQTHERVENGDPLTADILGEMYGEKKKEYYKPVQMDEEIKKEWMRIPHFYYDFYVFQYSTGLSAAHAIIDEVIEEGNAEDYLDMLRKGGSDYPLEVLEDLGVDMRKPEAVEKAIERYERRVEAMEEAI